VEEYARLETLAARRGLTVGEWVREIVLKASEPQPASAAEQTLLSEVPALRAIVINTVYDLANQTLLAADADGMTPERMKELIAKADAGKLEKALAQWRWDPTTQPAWLDQSFYVTHIEPLLANLTVASIASAIDVSRFYAGEIRRGNRIPHPRHWVRLAELVNITGDSLSSHGRLA
jgi:hypothetical protein